MSKEKIRAELKEARKHLGIATGRTPASDAAATLFVSAAILDLIRALEALTDDVDIDY